MTVASSEKCDGCGCDLSEITYSVDGRGFLCSGCTRETLIKDYQERLPNELDKPPVIVLRVGSCDRCGSFICIYNDCEAAS